MKSVYEAMGSFLMGKMKYGSSGRLKFAMYGVNGMKRKGSDGVGTRKKWLRWSDSINTKPESRQETTRERAKPQLGREARHSLPNSYVSNPSGVPAQSSQLVVWLA